MTDEEIEKALECCGGSIKGCSECPNRDKKSSSNCQNLCTYTLNYINRLKNDIKCEENKVYNTAKEILQFWLNESNARGDECDYLFDLAVRYGVELDND